MPFVYPTLLFGLALVAAPLIIHLINLASRRRVRWAAMDFLLKSHRKQRHWIWLRQLLLLLARMAIVALAVLMVARWTAAPSWISLLSRQVTHFYVVLDDSYSMGERIQGRTAFEEAKRAIASVANRATESNGAVLFTLALTSRSGQPNSGTDSSIRSERKEASGETRQDESTAWTIFASRTVDESFSRDLSERLSRLEPSATDLSPIGSCERLGQILGSASQESKKVIVISDFRKKDLEQASRMRDAIQSIESHGAEVTFIDCATRSAAENIGIVDISPAGQTRAVGVPLFVHFKVKNFGSKAVRHVEAQIRLETYPEPPQGFAPTPSAPTEETLPSVFLEEIQPNETITQRVQVSFTAPGKHAVRVTLPDDALPADNQRWCVIDCPDVERVLMVDGSVDEKASFYLGAALRPLEQSGTGILPEKKRAEELSGMTESALANYSAIYLCDVRRIDDESLKKLRKYVESGGGVCFFLGPQVAASSYNERFYRNGEGIFPAQLGDPLDMADLPQGSGSEGDLTVEPHPVFDFFRGESQTLLAGIRVRQFFSVVRANGSNDSTSPTWTPLAWTRQRNPLVIEKSIGRGTSIAFLTTASTEWNDWAKEPSFVVMALKLHAYLSSSARRERMLVVGDSVVEPLSRTRFRPTASCFIPAMDSKVKQEIKLRASDTRDPEQMLVELLGHVSDSAIGHIPRAGIYELFTTTLDNETKVNRFAMNHAPIEGSLAHSTPEELTARLSPATFRYETSESLSNSDSYARGARTMFLAGLLLVLLLVEQTLAYWLSYHPSALA